MKRFVRLLSAASLVILVLAGCPSPIERTGKGGSLVVTVTDGVSRSLLPGISMTPASYEVTGTGPNGSSFTRTLTGSAEVTVDQLAFGTWNVAVTAKNSSGDPIGAGTGTAVVHTNAEASLSVTVVPFSGLGTLSLNLAWTASDIDIPQVVSSLLPASGTARSLSFTVDPASGSASWSASDVPTGYHTLTLKLEDNGALAMGAVEVVRIVKDAATSGNFLFDTVNKAGGSLAVNITPEMGDPLTVTVAGASATKPANLSMSLSASIAETSVNVTYVWYVNAQAKGEGPTFAFDNSWPQGFYRVDVTAFSADGTRAGSGTCSVQVVGPAAGSMLTGPAPGTIGGQRAFDSHGNVYLFTYQGGLYRVSPTGTKTLLLDRFLLPGGPNGLSGSPLVIDDNTLLLDTGASGIMKLDLTTLALSPFASLDSAYYGTSNLLLDKNGIIIAGRTQTLLLPGGGQVHLNAVSGFMVYSDSTIFKPALNGIDACDLDGGNKRSFYGNCQFMYGIAMAPDGSVYAGMGAGFPTDVPIVICKLDPRSGVLSSFATVPNWVDSLVSDGNKYLYAGGFCPGPWSNPQMETIYRIDLQTGAVTPIP